MQSLPKNVVFDFPPDTIKHLRKMYDLDEPGQMDEAINLLDDWIKKQNHFIKKEFSREYLERAIISSKGSVERAKSRIDKNCTLRTLLPRFYKDYNSREDLDHLISPFKIVLLPKYAEDYYRVFMSKLPIKTNESMMLNFFRYIVIVWEYMKIHDYINGIVVVSDMRDIDIVDFVKSLNITDLHQAASFLLDGFGLRVKGFYLLTPSKTVDVLVTLLKQVMPAKIKNRIYVLKSPEALREIIQKDILPKEYEGGEKSIPELHDTLLDELSTKEFINYMKEVKNVGTDESLRQTDEFNDQYLGMAGTFRTLKVD